MPANRSPDRLADDATGNVEPKHLTETKTAGEPVSYLRDGEQPHYFFSHVNKGLRLERPDWDEKRTPHNVGYGHPGKRYLFVTDQRLLFLAGDTDDGDTVVSLPYEELTGSDANWGWTKARLSVDHRDGRTISFFDGGSHAKHVEDAADYVASRIAEVAASGPAPGGADTGSGSRSGNDTQSGGDTQVFTAGTTDGDSDGSAATGVDGDGPADTGADAGDDTASDTRVFSATPDDDGDADGSTATNDSGADADDVNFCPACGHDLQSYSERRFCASCGHRIR